MNDARAVAAADLTSRLVDVVAAAVDGAGVARLAVQDSSTADALSPVVDDRLAAARIRAERTVANHLAAADPCVAVILQLAAARVVASVDDAVAAAARVDAVDLCRDRSPAAAVSLEVVDEVAAARRVASVRAIHHRAAAAQRAPVVVHRRAAAAAVRVEGPRPDHTAAADVRPVVVRGAAAASGVAAEILPLQLAVAADVPVGVVDLVVAASALAVVVDGRSAAARVRSVELVARNVARATQMVVWTDHKTAAAAGVVREFLLDSAATDAGGSVVDDAVAACRGRAVRAPTYAVVPEQRRTQTTASRHYNKYINTPYGTTQLYPRTFYSQIRQTWNHFFTI